MNLTLLASLLAILGGGGLIGIIGKVINMGMKYQSLLSRVEQNERRDEEERKENALRFNELYASRNKTNETLVELTTTVKMMISTMDQQFMSLNQKLEELKNDNKR